VQLFVSDMIASLTPDVKRLRRFEKVNLLPGESTTVTFKLPLKDLAFVNTDNKRTLEAGDFNIEAGGQTLSFSVNDTIVF
jgi:beta-glucosidase